MALTRRLRSIRTVVIVIILAVVLVGGFGTYLIVNNKVSTNPGPKADGPTFYQALAAVNGSVSTQPGGPWILYAVWGIATPIPFSPNAIPWPQDNQSVNSCQAQFNGLTLWNGSIPLFNGSVNSGTAPFWQFAFFSNASQSISIAIDVLGTPRVYPSMSMSSRCALGTSLADAPWTWARYFTPFPADSPIMAQSAWDAIGGKWLSSNQPAYAAYILGSAWWGSGVPAGLILQLARCGEVGYAGVQPIVDVVLNANGTWNNYFNGSQSCGNVISLGPPPVYGPFKLYFAAPMLTNGGGALTVNQSFQVTYGNRSDSDASGLVTWMTGLNLTIAGGQRLPSVAPDCASWVPSLADCQANAPGWYAVLLSSSGAWLDSYPSSPNGSAWESPNVSFVSNQCLVVVAPSSWNVTGDVLSINGTAPHVLVNESITL